MNDARDESYDVVVVGGGSAGCAAAVGAARVGARTLLVERYGFLGGAATQSQVLSYCGFYKWGDAPERTVAGVGEEVLAGLRSLGLQTEPVRARSGNWIVMIDPEAAKLALDRVVLSSGVELHLHTSLVAAHRSGSRLDAISVADHRGIRRITAKAFVDASGEASLATFGEVELTQDSGAGHSQPASFPVRLGGVPAEVAVDRKLLTRLIAEYNAASPLLRIPREDGGVLVRLPVSGDFWWMAIDLQTDGLSGASLARAECSAREQAWQFLQVLRRHPGFEHAYLAASGPQIGIRETRRPRSEGDVVAADGRQGRLRSDGIARASWPMEVHVAPGQARFEHIGGVGHFDVPYAALKAQGVHNLRLAGRVVGSDSEAYGSLRVMGTAFATGHAAGISAALEAAGTLADAAAVRTELVRQGALI
jgi:hypothetical protein